MKKVYLVRYLKSDQGTFGQWITKGFKCMTAEPPWRDNKPNYSCIPLGIYECELVYSRRFRWVYTVKGVSDRELIRVHSGNLAGDVLKKYITHSVGCVLQGKYLGKLGGQTAVLCSRPTVRAFRDFMQGRPFELHIVEINF